MTSDWRRPQEPSDSGNERRAGRARGARARRAGGKGPSRWFLLGSAALLCAIAAGASLSAFSAPSGQRSASKTPAAALRIAEPTVPAASSAANAGSPTVRSNGIAKTALQWPTALTSQIRRWTAGSGGAALSAVTTQLGKATQAGGLKLYAQMRVTCTNLRSNAETARRAPPIPDGVMQRLYASTLVKLSSAAADCRSAVSIHQVGDEDQEIHVNNALLNQSLAELAAGSRQLYTATAEIRTLRR
jgi:hypothetical protein